MGGGEGGYGQEPDYHNIPANEAPSGSRNLTESDLYAKLPESVQQDQLNALEKQVKQNPCYQQTDEFLNCLKLNNSNIGTCQESMDKLVSCEKSANQATI